MIVLTVKTNKIVPYKQSLFNVLDKYLPKLEEKSILAVTSKIVSICEKKVIKIGEIDKSKLIVQEAEYYLPPKKNKFNITLTIKRGLLVPTAGIDESNGSGYYILWPQNPQKSANKIRRYLQKRFHLNYVGVIITDSKTSPLRWGTKGVAIAYSGFSPLNNYIGKPDIFGRKLKVTKANIMDSLAVSAVLVMGEGNEQTPLAIIKDIPFVTFKKKNPSKKELKSLIINIKDDLYGSILSRVQWRKGQCKI